MNNTPQPADKESPEAERTPAEWAAYWQKEIKASQKWLKRFHDKGQTIEGEYLAQSRYETANDGARYNIFWANVQVILSAVYSKLPIPEVDRTHIDQNDDVARVAALMLERIFEFELKNLDESPADVYKQALIDRFVPGLGCVWPRYEFEEDVEQIAALTDDNGMEIAPAYEKVTIRSEAVPLDYVRWDDVFFSPIRTWQQLRWQARRVYMSKNAATKRFGATIASKLVYKTASKSQNMDDPLRLSTEHVAEVFEIWCKETKAVYFYSTGCDLILDIEDDPLGLSGFFPMKRPLMATHVSSAFIPRADYAMVQDQYSELNLVAARSRMLTEALRVTGVYDKTSDGVQAVLTNGGNNKLVPVDNWAMFAEKGGIKGVVDWFPLEMVVSTLVQLTNRKTALVQEIYEILGLSDIMRGTSVASETATAQQLKAQYGSARMQKLQLEIAEFITMATRTRAEIICNHWQPQTIIERSQIMMTPDAQYAEAAVQLLKSKTDMALRLTIQADTIAAPNWNEEKQERIDFLQAVSQFIGMSMPLIEKEPGATPFLVQMLQWAATGFKAGKQIEGVLDQALAALQTSLTQPKMPPPPTGAELKDKAQAAKNTAEARRTNAETMLGLHSMGIPPSALNSIPPEGPSGVQLPPGEGGPGRPPQTALPH